MQNFVAVFLLSQFEKRFEFLFVPVCQEFTRKTV